MNPAILKEWASSLARQPWAFVRWTPEHLNELRKVAQSSAKLLIPAILGGGRTCQEDGLFRQMLFLYPSQKGRSSEHAGRPLEILVVADLDKGLWWTGDGPYDIEQARDVVSLARWHWYGAADTAIEADRRAEEKLTAHLGLALLTFMAGVFGDRA